MTIDLLAALDAAIRRAREDRKNLLDTIPCARCTTETYTPEGCSHGIDLCPTCRDEGGCKDCEREDAADYVAEMRADR